MEETPSISTSMWSTKSIRNDVVIRFLTDNFDEQDGVDVYKRKYIPCYSYYK